MPSINIENASELAFNICIDTIPCDFSQFCKESELAFAKMYLSTNYKMTSSFLLEGDNNTGLPNTCRKIRCPVKAMKKVLEKVQLYRKTGEPWRLKEIQDDIIDRHFGAYKRFKGVDWNEIDAIDIYSKRTKHVVKQVGVAVNPAFPYICSTPDGITKVLKNGKLTPRLIEIKSPKDISFKRCPINKLLNDVVLNNGYYTVRSNSRTYSQIQVVMHIFKIAETDVIYFSKTDFDIRVITVSYNEQFCIKAMKEYSNVYFNLIFPLIVKRANKEIEKYCQ